MNWKDKVSVIYHFRNDDRVLIVTKPEYRFDGKTTVVLDSKTAELALKNKANWKTINGSHVLVGKGGKIVAGMGGKFKTVPANKVSVSSLNGFKGTVDSKDISDDIEYQRVEGKSGAQVVAERLGISGKPRLVNDAEFREAAKECGVIAYRTWGDYGDRKAGEFKKEFAHSDSIPYNSVGEQVVGSGIYMAATSRPKRGELPVKGKRIAEAVKNSVEYGAPGKRATAVITFDKSMKIADGELLYNELLDMDRKTAIKKYGMDLGVYCASKGYDAVTFYESKDVDYVVVYNRTKLIVLDDPDHMGYGLDPVYNPF